MAFFLSSFFRRGARGAHAAPLPDLSGTAHLAIDLQDECCNPQRLWGNEKTARAARQVAAVAPVFGTRGLTTIWLRHSACGDFYAVTPVADARNILLVKDRRSAFDDDALGFHALLQAMGIRRLIGSGTNFSGCVLETLTGAAAHGYEVWLMLDATADDGHHLGETVGSMQRYRDSGVILTDSTEVMAWLSNAAHQLQQHRHETSVPWRPLPV